MKLNIAERIALLNVLPPQGNVVTLKVVRELQGQLGFTEEELKRFKIKNKALPDGRTTVRWNPKLTDKTKDVKIGDAAKAVIVEQLTRLNSRNQLHITMLPLYERFVEAPPK